MPEGSENMEREPKPMPWNLSPEQLQELGIVIVISAAIENGNLPLAEAAWQRLKDLSDQKENQKKAKKKNW